MSSSENGRAATSLSSKSTSSNCRLGGPLVNRNSLPGQHIASVGARGFLTYFRTWTTWRSSTICGSSLASISHCMSTQSWYSTEHPTRSHAPRRRGGRCTRSASTTAACTSTGTDRFSRACSSHSASCEVARTPGHCRSVAGSPGDAVVVAVVARAAPEAAVLAIEEDRVDRPGGALADLERVAHLRQLVADPGGELL